MTETEKQTLVRLASTVRIHQLVLSPELPPITFITDPDIPSDQLEFRDPATGELLAKLTGLRIEP